jgi:hypothetical protein
VSARALRFRFVARLERLPSATGLTQIAPVPDEMAAAWKQAGVKRLVGTVNGHAVKRALQNHAEGGSYVMIGRPLLKEIGAGLRSTLTFDLAPDPTPDAIDMPPEFAEVLRQDAAAAARWSTFTVGRQRSLLHYVTGAKQEATRIRRSLELAVKIREHRLASDLGAPRRTRPSRANP